ncbi:hypothetical protein BC937DRAFT_87194 [Endogone sp. FLAS-F59071]|nr:hypothetical protein BC937DRAFT_87194 [Endogone sp. FLAS-F59071]|eukprot:RUS19617.1 hypothetical protein BC937DRAFT_87194 [Endogone sp. FLAS-F59071]
MTLQLFPTANKIMKWNIYDIILHLTEKFPNDFDNEDFNILKNEKIKGCRPASIIDNMYH